MKLLRARFENFRLLRDLKLEFRTTPEKRLTVIRAANESGKTTILHGLRWALYGDDALPGRKDFRLHPIDWDGPTPATITVTIDFEITKHRFSGDQRIDKRKRYQLVRTVTEDVELPWRDPSTVKLFEITSTGTKSVPFPEVVVKQELLPPELRDVFFTDGDRALRFIEADVTLSTKRQRVEQAIRSLLGLGILERAVQHVKNARADANRQAKTLNPAGNLGQVASRLEQLFTERDCLQNKLDDTNSQLVAFDERQTKLGRQISLALAEGDKDELRRELTRVKETIERLDKDGHEARAKHSKLFRTRAVADGLLTTRISGAYQLLEQLRDRGKIPNATIPVLEDRLETGTCICGEALDASDPAGAVRHRHITKLIAASRHTDEIQRIVTELYYREMVQSDDNSRDGKTWLASYTDIARNRDQVDKDRKDAGQRLRSLEAKLDALPNTDIKALRRIQSQYKDQHDRCLEQKGVLTAKLERNQDDREQFEEKRKRLLQAEKKGDRVRAQLAITDDIVQVLEAAERRIKTEELRKVSEVMNTLFLRMIGADSREVTDGEADQQRSIIRRAEINDTFDILVYGPHGRQLNPDRDLNGASRRALTLAFILALTKVSKVEAPNVIDTPLGMTSGFVKRSVLQIAATESRQLILFLTHDEIAGCEDILDELAATVVTLTNPVHYPKILVHPPGVTVRKILLCECNHRTVCRTCRRKDLDNMQGVNQHEGDV